MTTLTLARVTEAAQSVLTGRRDANNDGESSLRQPWFGADGVPGTVSFADFNLQQPREQSTRICTPILARPSQRQRGLPEVTRQARPGAGTSQGAGRHLTPC